ncbi:MAG TPA: hypothetical protein VH880_14315, partial [Anaeromyxobacteraceae bacterium]
EEDPVERGGAMQYFVACAFDRTVVISLGTRWVWSGAFGLAPSLRQFLAGLRGGKTQQLSLLPDEGKWVSACLMAHANVRGSHEYVSIRGNPPGRLETTAGERWAMGYPEGVFFADLLNFNIDNRGLPKVARRKPSREDLERSFTQSLNLPDGYGPGTRWWPPNVALGRTLDFDAETLATAGGLRYRAARRLGAFHARPPPGGSDPDYGDDKVCVRPGENPTVGDCGTGEVWRPLFVHAPRLVNIEALDETVVPTLTMQALKEGDIGHGQFGPCDRESCVGSFDPVSVRRPPRDVPNPTKPARLVNLRRGQGAVAVLRFVPKNEPEGLEVDMEEKFTAIVRYTSRSDARATVEVGTRNGGWQTMGEWWPRSEGGPQWLQVYPVKPFADEKHSSGLIALKIRIMGLGDGSDSPDLDVAGFVPGPPWCHRGDKPFFRVCRPGEPRMRLLRR